MTDVRTLARIAARAASLAIDTRLTLIEALEPVARNVFYFAAQSSSVTVEQVADKFQIMDTVARWRLDELVKLSLLRKGPATDTYHHEKLICYDVPPWANQQTPTDPSGAVWFVVPDGK